MGVTQHVCGYGVPQSDLGDAVGEKGQFSEAVTHGFLQVPCDGISQSKRMAPKGCIRGGGVVVEGKN